ncbi:glycoside hydrolase family 18 protein, partial [Aulographum hederae CBS 113979]
MTGNYSDGNRIIGDDERGPDGPIQCTPTEACIDGSCCNKDGKCGYRSVHCAPDICISNCDAKAMCGVDSKDGNKKCGLNLCCSYYGWCGVDQIHCGDKDEEGFDTPCQDGFGGCQVKPSPSCGAGSGTASNGRKIGYWQSWNVRQRACNRIMPDQIVTDGFTHLYFAFASIDPNTYNIRTYHSDDERLFPLFTALKTDKMQTWIAIGGFDFSDPGPTHTTWSDMCSTQDSRAAFITSLVQFMDKWGFQGIDLDWEYPASDVRGGREEDTQNLVSLVKEMREAFGTTYGISSILAPDYWYLRGFDPKGMEPYVDWFGFMAYDLHGAWDVNVKALGAQIRPQTDARDIDKGLVPLWFDELDPAKVNFGLAYYGRGYTAEKTDCLYFGCPFTGPSNKAPCTNFDGVMSNREMQAVIDSTGIRPELIADAMVQQIAWDDQWIGYDDPGTIAMKMGLANDRCMGGTMVWSVDFDSG